MAKINNRLTWIELQKKVKEVNNNRELIGITISVGIIEIERDSLGEEISLF